MSDPAANNYYRTQTPVFRLELPLRLAPAMNTLMRQHWHARHRLASEIQGRIQVAKGDWPKWSCGARVEVSGQIINGKMCTRKRKNGGRKRLLRVVRYTAGRLDESAGVDTLGGKLATDELVTANILRDDSEAWVVREGCAERAPQGQGRLMVEVFEAP